MKKLLFAVLFLFGMAAQASNMTCKVHTGGPGEPECQSVPKVTSSTPQSACAPGTGLDDVPCIEAAADYIADFRFPIFVKHKVKFMCTLQPEFGSGNLLVSSGSAWIGWGGSADTRSEIFTYIDDDLIMSYGSLHGFTTYFMAECERRAELYAAIPEPDPNSRVSRLNYAMKMLMIVQTGPDGIDRIIVPPAPLP